MSIGLFRKLAPATLLMLAACTGGPQQPSDVVDDQGTPTMSSDASLSTTNRTTPPRTVNPSPADDLLTAGIGGSNASLAALAGQWAADAAACETPGPDLTLTISRFETIERACDISDVIDGGRGSLTVGLRCTTPAGDVDGELVKLSPTPTGIDLSVVGGDSGPQSLVRCP